MAENESLDVGNRRFRWVVSDLLRGRPPAEIADRLIKKVGGAWNYVLRHGFDVVGIINLANSDDNLVSAVRDTGGSDFAHLIKSNASPAALPAAILDRVNRAALDMVLESGIQKVICHREGRSVVELATVKQQVIAAAEPALEQLSNALLNATRSGLRLRLPKAAAARSAPS